MSLGVVVNTPEGMVVAAESRVTLTWTNPAGVTLPITFDNATKVLHFRAPHDFIGVVTWGAASINWRTAHSFVTELEALLGSTRLTVKDYCTRIAEFLRDQWNAHDPNYAGDPMVLTVAGYNAGQPYGEVWQVSVPKPCQAQQIHPGDFGVNWGGQTDIVNRILVGVHPSTVDAAATALQLNQQGKDTLKTLLPGQLPVPIEALPLQDSVDLAVFLISSTITAQRLTLQLRGCGGEIDVAVITRNEPLRFIRRKALSVGEE
jgi:hypothetical protein